MRIIFKILISTLAVILAAYIVPGIIVKGIGTAIIVALVLGLINVTVRPILWLLTLPITLVTFGLFSFVLNALMLWFVGRLVPGFEVVGFFAALLGSLIIALFGAIGNSLLHKSN